MANYTEYFTGIAYKPKYHIGDRVRGFWNKIPFSGTVYIDNCIDGESPPVVTVHSDLPIKYKNTVYQIVRVGHKDINLLK